MNKSHMKLWLLLFLMSGSYIMVQKAPDRRPAGTAEKRIFIGIDGLSRETFDYAKKELGYFQAFGHVSTHVAPFPSISDYSWNILVQSRAVHGKRGAIKSYEAARFDRDRNALVSDPREYFRRLGQRQLYFNGAFEHYLNPYIESVLYLPTEELPRMELKQLKEAVIADSKELVTVMVASNDALAHTRANAINFLKDLDLFLREIDDHYRSKGIDTEIIIVSDHGQAARFFPGEKPLPLKPMSIGPILKRARLASAETLKKSSDVVIPIMALGNYGTVFFKDKRLREVLVRELKKEAAFNLAIWKEDSRDRRTVSVKIADKKGHAELIVKKDDDASYFYFYRPVSSNPLQLPQDAIGQEIGDEEAREASMKTPFPDSLYRIAFSAFQEEADFPDLLFTLQDDYFLQGELSSFTSMFQTHGSLSPRSSFGVVASTHSSQLDEMPYLRTSEVLGALELAPHSLFRPKEEGLLSRPEKSLARAAAPGYQGIETGIESFSNRRIFEILNKVVHHSQYVFDLNSVGAVASIIKPMLNSSGTKVKSNPALDMSKVDVQSAVSLNDLAKLVDIMIRTGDLDAVQKDQEFIKLKDKLAKNGRSKGPPKSLEQHLHDNRPLADAAKKVVMKAYSTTFLLERALEIPEFSVIQDPRDIAFRKSWENKQKALNEELLNETAANDVKKLFAEVFTERRIAEEISPMRVPYLYRPNLEPMDNITVVYVPGIYNALFDNEIFRMGLDHLVNDLGLRVISPPVFSSCSSDYNGKVILDFLKKDQIEREALGHQRPKYIILGYSKGGVDSLHGFLEDPQYVQENVHGLVAMASPIKGTSILNKTDLPFELIYLLGSEEIPEICKGPEKASISITPEGASAFLRKNSKHLVGLTRYYSLSFSEDIKNSHLFMKATKNIAQFGEANDGVVTVSSSTFPPEFQAVNLGVVKADHLAGIVASKFPQEAFIESIVVTLLELDAFNEERNEQYNELAVYSSGSTTNDIHKSNLDSKVGWALKSIFNGLKKDSEDLKAIERAIKNKLKGTAYETKDFSLVRKKDKIHIVYSEPVFNNKKYLAWIKSDEHVTVENVDQVMEVLLSRLQASGKNLIKTGVSMIDLIPMSKRTPFKVPANQLGYVPELRINLRKLGGFIEGKRVTPVTRASHPKGIEIVYDHGTTVDFRNEYQLSFESTAPFDADDNDQSGWAPFLDSSKNVMAKMASKNSSIRLTTYSLRFLASDFPHLNIDIQVNNDVAGANALFGGSGKDDSAFQLWLTFRVVGSHMDRALMSSNDDIKTIGYYFGDAVSGRDLKVGQFYENYYSKKNFIIAVLPEAHQKLIGLGKDMLGKPLLSKNNLLEDIKEAFPELDAGKVEIVGITFQHDSNDTKGDSETLFKSVKFKAVPE